VLPARELLADMQFEAGKFEDALASYRAVLDGSPNRLNAMIGASLAAGRLGLDTVAAEYRSAIATQTAPGDGVRPNLAEALAGRASMQ